MALEIFCQRFRVVVMYLLRQRWPSKNGKAYKTAYLRQSVRVGRQVKPRIVANLSHCSDEELDAIEWALAHKRDLERAKGALARTTEAVGPLELKEGPSVGAVWTPPSLLLPAAGAMQSTLLAPFRATFQMRCRTDRMLRRWSDDSHTRQSCQGKPPRRRSMPPGPASSS
jgi:hypothetical protein